MAKKHGGTHHVQGVLNRGTAPRPSGPYHGGTHALKGVTKPVSTPASRQPRLATSYHGTKGK
jgi:hypothetical protein